MKSLFICCFSVLFLAACKNEKPSAEPETKLESEANSKLLPDFKMVESAVLSAGKLYRFENFESQFVAARNIDVWIPEDYSPSTAYATLYMHDGQMLFDSTTTWNKQEWKVDETMSQLMSEGKIKPSIVIGMWNVNENRHSDYFPQKPWENLSESTREAVVEENHAQSESLFRKDINSDNYIKFITEEVIPLVEKNLSVSEKFEDRAVAGSSMGGLISWYTLLEKPEVFGAAVCISTHWPGAMPIDNNPIPEAFFAYIKEKLPNISAMHRIYFDFGTETLDQLYPPFEAKVNEVFALKPNKESTFRNLKFEGTNHSENAWNQRLHIPLEFAFSPEPSID